MLCGVDTIPVSINKFEVNEDIVLGNCVCIFMGVAFKRVGPLSSKQDALGKVCTKAWYKGCSFSLFLELKVYELIQCISQGEKLELCYDPAWDRRVIAQVKDFFWRDAPRACDMRGREVDYLPSPRVWDRNERGSHARDRVLR